MEAEVKFLCFLAVAIFSLAPGLALAKDDKAKEPEKPVIVASIEAIAKGKAFTERTAPNVRFILSATRALFSISF
jgi:hypothetical protein